MIWDFQDTLTRRLLLWSALSMGVGVVLLLTGDTWWRGWGLQALIWGIIDAAIAVGGRSASEKRRTRQGGEQGIAEREARQLRRLLWINAGLDVLYVMGGLALALTIGLRDPFAGGSGWGIIVQGGFLLIFDLLHALATPMREEELPAFAGLHDAEHKAFTLQGGRPAALLVHGFGGTPAEMKALGHALHKHGWTVDVPLLPGFGSDIETLTRRRYPEWVAAVEARAERLLAAGHAPLLLVGYSMGAALSVVASARVRPVGMVLLAPFWWEEKPLLRLTEFFVRPFLPIGFRPLRRADLNDKRLREGITKFMPGLDLDDAQVQATVRNFRVPMGLIDELRRLSRRLWAVAPSVNIPTMIVQGTRDTVVRPPLTRKLLARLGSGVTFAEVNSEHDLTLATNAAYVEVERQVVGFAGNFIEDAG